jgi:hypothetical protein
VLRLTEKTAYSTDDGQLRFRRRYGPARTPFERLCATGVLPQEQRRTLEALRDQTNPRRLRQEIYTLLETLFSLPGAQRGQTENVLDTLTALQPTQKGDGTPVTLSIDRTVAV